MSMFSRELRLAGAFEFVPEAFPDNRGVFFCPLQETAFRAAVGRPVFPVVQTNHSVSRRQAARGIHFTATLEGSEKYVYCSAGSAQDFVVDLRPESPTFGRWDSVRLDAAVMNAVYIPSGFGHAFLATAEPTAMTYLMSVEYLAAHEREISLFDPEIGLPLPDPAELVLSERDSAAPSLREILRGGLLPGR